MSLSKVPRALRFTASCALVLCLSACASVSGSGAHQGVNEQAVNVLYQQLDQAGKNYADALEQQARGNQGAAEKTLESAIQTLKVASAKCGNTPGCDPQRFFSVFDHLLRLKNVDDLGDLANDGDTSTPDADTAADESSAVSQVVPQAQRSVTLLRGHKLSDLITMNGPVKSALEDWLTWLRPNLMNAYVNYQYMRFEMRPAYHADGLPEAILFGIMAKESGGKVHAVSRSGAAGPLQFMYTTGRRFGLHTVDGFDQRFSPKLSAQANAAYMQEQLKVFNDNLELVLAAYNGGEGRVRRVVDGHNGNSFYDPHIYFSLPRQTRHYVPMVLAAAWLFMHPHSYNLKFPKIDGKPGHIRLIRPTSLSELTICLGQAHHMQRGWFRILRNLNPRLNSQKELPAGTRLTVPDILEKPYRKQCKSGPWPILASDLHSGKVPAPPASLVSRHYRVRRGDTLSGIVKRLGCSSVHHVAYMNHLRAPHYAIRAGEHLRLPRCSRR